MMAPLSLFFLFLFGVFTIFGLIMSFPGFVLGLVFAPILHRSAWYVEFLYPWNIVKRGHLWLMSRGSPSKRTGDKNRGFHSRTIEQRIEVIPGRIYIHPIPQYADNVGYLILCLPAPPKRMETTQETVTISIQESNTDPIVALLVDCGDATCCVEAINMIQDFHYNKSKIEIQSILSTHKHHDHTGGNGALLQHEMGANIKAVYGGAVERVPHCTDFLTNGERLGLAHSGSNNMGQLIGVEAIAAPSHTRGSLVFRLYSLANSGKNTDAEYLFTGDLIFSGGGGVPFESDIGVETERDLNRSHGNSFFRGNIGGIATERCFAEVIARVMPDKHSVTADVGGRILLFPGHEYTEALLTRQFHLTTMESCRWKNFAPKDFFLTASQLYLAMHRRTLPHNTGKLLCVPTTLKRELSINPNLRSLRKTGEMVVRAIYFWYENFCKAKIDPAEILLKHKKKPSKSGVKKTPSAPKSWTMDAANFNHDVFTTVYTLDLENVIEQISSGKLGKKQGASKLREMADKLNQPVVNRRSIPGYLPSDKNIWRGVSGLARLGAGPSAMTLKDSRIMKLPPPIDSNSDKVSVSLKRLLLVLGRLGLLESSEGGEENMTYMFQEFWREASKHTREINDSEEGYHIDEIELGVLKWVMYGIPAKQPDWFSKTFCMPCSKVPEPQEFPQHPANSMKQKSGEMVSHDVYACLLCRNATGCLHIYNVREQNVGDNQRKQHPKLVIKTESVSDDEAGTEIDLNDLTLNFTPNELL
jgi:glyoxylase-like metal-dependent hydrolase (beta-lactamase superfamily II)